jgi:hypothetical protein
LVPGREIKRTKGSIIQNLQCQRFAKQKLQKVKQKYYHERWVSLITKQITAKIMACPSFGNKILAINQSGP